MMIMVVMIFGICWFPYHVYFIVANAFPDINYSKYIQVKYLTNFELIYDEACLK